MTPHSIEVSYSAPGPLAGLLYTAMRELIERSGGKLERSCLIHGGDGKRYPIVDVHPTCLGSELDSAVETLRCAGEREAVAS
jgi:hypothetical protein